MLSGLDYCFLIELSIYILECFRTIRNEIQAVCFKLQLKCFSSRYFKNDIYYLVLLTWKRFGAMPFTAVKAQRGENMSE